MSKRRCCCTGGVTPSLPGCDEFPQEDYQVLLCLNLVLTAPQCFNWSISPCSSTAVCDCGDSTYEYEMTSYQSSFSCVINSGAVMSKGWLYRNASAAADGCYCCNDVVEYPVSGKMPASVCYVTEANGGPGSPCVDEDYVYSSTNLYAATRFTSFGIQYLRFEFRLTVDVDIPAGSCDVVAGCPATPQTVNLAAIQTTYPVATWIIIYRKDTPPGTPEDPDCCWCLVGCEVQAGGLPGQNDRPGDCCETALEYPENCCRQYTPSGACSCTLVAGTNDCTQPMDTSSLAYIYCGSPPLNLRCTHVPC